MRKAAIGSLAGALVATAAFGSAAYAATYTVTVGGATSGDHVFFASSQGAIDFVVRGATTDIEMGCGDVNAEGKVHAGTYDTASAPIATITSVVRTNTPETFAGTDWKDCVGPLGISMSVSQGNNWEIYADGTATSGNSDVVTGYISGPGGAPLNAMVYETAGGPTGTACRFEVTGYAEGSFDEASQKLIVSENTWSNLTVGTVYGSCFGLIATGDPASFNGSFDVGPDVVGNAKDTEKPDWTTFPVLIAP